MQLSFLFVLVLARVFDVVVVVTGSEEPCQIDVVGRLWPDNSRWHHILGGAQKTNKLNIRSGRTKQGTQLGRNDQTHRGQTPFPYYLTELRKLNTAQV